ncbi:hypothetical protein H4R33_004396 [Dimargaris cristalligena]|nr:hypothetical protein H4R33_004396 [Dimargaris cristalligena]
MTVLANPHELVDRLKQHETVFNSILNLIPPQNYFVETSVDEGNSRYMKHLKKRPQKTDGRFQNKVTKKAKFDPESQHSVTEIQQERAQRAKAEDAAEEDDNNASTADGQVNGHSNKVAKFDLSAELIDISPVIKNSDASDIRARLQERIALLRSNRTSTNEEGSGRSAKEIKANREKRRKLEQAKAKKDKTSAGYVPNLHQSVLDMGSTQPGGAGPSSSNATHSNSQSKAKSHTSRSVVKEDVSFGSLDFKAPDDDETPAAFRMTAEEEAAIKKGHKSAGLSTAQKLRQVQQKQQKLAELAESDPTKHAELQETLKWSRLTDLAEGKKLTDDVGLLKKSVKREQRQKRKSEKEWTERKAQVEDMVQKRQEKRNANLQSRVDAIKDRRMGKKVKKTAPKKKQRPGFEGSSRIAKKQKQRSK